MGLLSFLGIGNKTEVTTTQTAQNTTNVDVASNITNVINLDSLAEAFDKFFGVFSANSAAEVDANILAAQATLGASLVNAKVQQNASTQVANSVRQGFLVLGLIMAGAVFLFMKRKRK